MVVKIIKKSKPKATLSEYLLGIDFGSTNIGLALGKNGLVMPLRSISGKNEAAAIDEINRAAIENKVTKFVVGLPLSAGDKETVQSLNVRRFAKLLKIHSKRQVIFQNEFGTTSDIEHSTDEITESYTGNKKPTDHFAAALILRKYYDSIAPTKTKH